MEQRKQVIIIGGGIVGLATAYQLLSTESDVRVLVLEKEREVGRHQTRNNSGVLHAGLYYKPGSAKARLAVTGIRAMTAFCRTHEIAHEICGKLVVAADAEELPRLRALHERGRQNGLQGMELLDPARMRMVEPHVGGVAALRVPEEGIVDYSSVCNTLVRLIQERDGRVLTGAEARRLRPRKAGWIVETPVGEFDGAFVVGCAGLHADRIAALGGARRETRIIPFRGEYYKLRRERESLVQHLIYPVPDPRFPFLGVHLTRMIRGGVEAGPNAVLALAREGYQKTRINLYDLCDALSYRGLWKFLARYPRMSWAEVRRSFSKELFCVALQRLVPDIRPEDLEPGGAGVRAQAMHPDGTLVEDFHFVRGRNALYVVNAPSPAATASLAIGAEIARAIGEAI